MGLARIADLWRQLLLEGIYIAKVSRFLGGYGLMVMTQRCGFGYDGCLRHSVYFGFDPLRSVCE